MVWNDPFTIYGQASEAHRRDQPSGGHGYESVTQSIEIHYDMIRRIMESYGILMTRKTVSEGMQRMRTGETPEE